LFTRQKVETAFLNCSNLQFQMLEKNIILFDGVCNYCNSVVNFIIKRDKKNIFRFAPLQSEAGAVLANKYHIPPTIDSFIYIENDTVHTFSTGALKVCKHLGGLWPALSALLIIPKFIRDGFYKWFAKNRYKWFGKKEVCMIPAPNVKAKFLM
jgi:predicted DCC family thiol-disulfide oxidoreductase YuxK